MSAANQDVTVAVARAESRVLAAARALHHARVACRLAWGQASGRGSEFHRRELVAARDAKKAAVADLDQAIAALADADAAEDAEIAAYEAELARRQAEHEADLDAAEAAAEAADSDPDYAAWYAEYEADLVDRARCERTGSSS